MDNLTHSLAGLLCGELAYRLLSSPGSNSNSGSDSDSSSGPKHDLKARRSIFLWASILAGNFPDFDLIYTNVLTNPLGYLLHHRGHTHTFVTIPIQMALIYIILVLIPRFRTALRADRIARRGTWFLIVLSLIFHMLLDSLNSYGIHPFHPLDSRWYFSDLVFIVEPFLWILLGTPFAMTIQRRWPKRGFLGFLIGAPLIFATVGLIPWYSALLLLSLSAILILIHKRSPLGSARGVVSGAVFSGVFVLSQIGFHHLATKAVRTALQAENPGSMILDVVLMPLPSDPLCWSVISIARSEEQSTYQLRRGLVSTAPRWIAARSCNRLSQFIDERAGSPFSETPEIVWIREENHSVARLREKNAQDCFFNAWMRFARAPSVTENEATDLRFSRRGRENFSTLHFKDISAQACPRWVPGWQPPRADLLNEDNHAL